MEAMPQTYEQALEWLYRQLPVFHQQGKSAYKPGVANTLRLCAWLGNPERRFQTIHVAGTNGKGSSSHMLASVLQHAAYKTGLYTSPHLFDFRERIRINGKKIEADFVLAFVQRYIREGRQAVLDISFFELTVGMAFAYFAEEQVDIAVIETGVGGLHDSTNVITPILSLITNIGFDHKDILGNTLAEIAYQKAGIIKDNVPVVVSEHGEESDPVFENVAKKQNAALHYAEDEVRVVENDSTPARTGWLVDSPFSFNSIATDLQGSYQAKNLQGVLTAIHTLREKRITIPDDAVLTGLYSVTLTTGLQGRWQVLTRRPTLVVDTGHNAHGLQHVLAQAQRECAGKLHIVLGVVADKDVASIGPILPPKASYYFATPSVARGKAAHLLANDLSIYGIHGLVWQALMPSLKALLDDVPDEDMILVTGSTFLVADLDFAQIAT